MPCNGTLAARGPRALDLANFFIADVQTGFGPFVAVYLTMHKWTQVQIGFALTLGTIVALISQLPAGALVDALHNKRAAASGALIGVMVAALLLAIQPTELPVTSPRRCTDFRVACSRPRSPRSACIWSATRRLASGWDATRDLPRSATVSPRR